MVTRYEHAGGAAATTLSGGITSTATSLTLADATNWPTGSTYKFWIVINRGKATEEKILCTARTGTGITGMTRGQDGTTAASHEHGETVEHILTASEVDEWNAALDDPGANWAEGNAAYHAPQPLPAGAMGAVGGSPSLSVTDTWYTAWLLDGSVNEAIGGTLIVPAAWATVNIKIAWSNAGAGSGGVNLRALYRDVAHLGSLSTTAATAIEPTASSSGLLRIDTLATGVAVTPGNQLLLAVQRRPGEAGDTLSNDIAVMTLYAERAS